MHVGKIYTGRWRGHRGHLVMPAPSLTGGVLMLFGPQMLRIVRFAIVFSLLANPLPHSLLSGMTVWIQNARTLGAAGLMDLLGLHWCVTAT